MALVEVKIPDIGDFKDVEIIELLVAPGDTVRVEQSLLTVESDKASMEIPSSHAGVVKELKVKLGDKVNQGVPVLLIETQAADAAAPAGDAAAPPPPPPAPDQPQAIVPESPAVAAVAEGRVELRVPDIGDFAEVSVIEVFIKPGDKVKVEQSLITVESDKASMEIPSSHAGVVRDVRVKLGEKVSMGSVVAVI
ncbi:MAG: biotin/lipoyl-containing protein, partial [Burkholderiaceae bacterium]